MSINITIKKYYYSDNFNENLVISGIPSIPMKNPVKSLIAS